MHFSAELTRSAAMAVGCQLLACRTHTAVLGRMFVDLWSRKTHEAAAAIFTFLCAPVGTCRKKKIIECN